MTEKKKKKQVAEEEMQQEKTAEQAVEVKETETETTEPVEEVKDETAQKLEEAESKLQAMSDSMLRLRADFDNYRKRNAKLRTDSIAEGKEQIVVEILKTLDNFENALSVECADKNYASGMQMIYRMMCDTLQNIGLEEIQTDIPFDPKYHEAIAQDEVEGAESGAITQVLRKGYKLDSKVIRAAMVKVAK